jgi:hypothetical protein
MNRVRPTVCCACFCYYCVLWPWGLVYPVLVVLRDVMLRGTTLDGMAGSVHAEPQIIRLRVEVFGFFFFFFS